VQKACGLGCELISDLIYRKVVERAVKASPSHGCESIEATGMIYGGRDGPSTVQFRCHVRDGSADLAWRTEDVRSPFELLWIPRTDGDECSLL
jgi:hypothetical protein